MNLLAVAGFSAALLGFAGLSLLLAFALRGGGTAGRRLLIASATTTLWAFAHVLNYTTSVAPAIILAAEVARDGAWLFALLAIAPTSLPRWFAGAGYCVWGAWVAASFTGVSVEAIMSGGGFCMSLLLLLLLEQLYRNAPEAARRDLKFLAIGVGGLFTYDLFLYAQAILLSGLDAISWHVRGLANVMMIPLLALGARRLPDTNLRLFISRQVTFYTSTFLAAGIYLLLMSFAGYAIREFGGAWGEISRGVFLFGAFALLMSLVTSAAMRHRLRVFVSKHFYRNKYDYRVEWLRFIRTLSSSEEGDLHRACVQAVAQTLSSPGGVLFVLDAAGRRLEPTAAWPLALADLPAVGPISVDDPMIELMRRRRWIVDVQERRTRAELYENVALPEWLVADPRWRIVAPIFRVDALTGVFVLFDPPPQFELAFEDRDLLHTMGQHVATIMAQHESDRRVTEMSQFETYNRLTAFLMHDLKNCAAQLSLVVGNAVKHRHNPEFIDDAIATISNTSNRVTRLIELLSKRNSVPVDAPPVKITELVSAAIERCQARRPRPRFERGTQCACLVNAEREGLVSAIEHVVRNAQDATAESGHVEVDITDDDRVVRVNVTDDGAGMDAEFVRHQLFRPFHSTKGAKGMGIGAYQARELVLSLGGDIEVESRPGVGTRFSFVLPVAS